MTVTVVRTENELRVLLIPATARDGEITRSLLAVEGLTCLVCTTPRKVASEIDVGVGTIVLTEEAFVSDGFDALLAKLANQPAWSDIPTVILMRGERAGLNSDPVLRLLRNVTLLERPAPMRSVVSAVQAAVRGRERQYQIRDQFETIREGQLRFEVLANFIPHLAWMARPDGGIFWYNQRWYDFTGTTADQMEGWGWQTVIGPGEADDVLAHWRASIRTGEPFDMTFHLRGRDASYRPFLTRVMPFRDTTGQIVLWFGTNTDVTEQRRIVEERDELLASERAARADAEHAGRLKDEFLATLSHELRTPLNAILGWTHILRRHNRHDAELTEGLSVVERNARMQAQLIEDLLDMSRIISGKLRLDVQEVDLVEVTNAAIESLIPAAEAKGIQFERTLDARAGPVRGDASRLQQVVWNLLSNAIKFTQKNGTVQVGLRRGDGCAEISVSDSGSGINPEFLPYVFERFRQADASTTRAHRGLGLGLAIVKNLVELHGGKVRARSSGENMGATFEVELPLMPQRVADTNRAIGDDLVALSAGVADCPVDAEVLRGVSVLVIDDEEDARRLVSRVLEECNATVVQAASAAEAREILRHARPTVLVSDIGMPNEDGYEFIRKLRLLPDDQGGNTPAAALTAFARPEYRARALRAGYQSHLSKPIEASELLAVVASLSGRASEKVSS